MESIKLPDGINITESEITVNGDVNDYELEKAIHSLFELSNNAINKATALRVAIGGLICIVSARNGWEWAEAIDMLKLPEKTGLSFRQLYKFPKIYSTIPPESRYPNLTITHLDIVSSFSAPKDIKHSLDFQQDRNNLLKDANSDPNNFTKNKMIDEMRKLQSKYGIDPKRKPKKSSIINDALNVFYAKIIFTDKDLSELGIEKRLLSDWTEHYINELIELEIITPENINLPFMK